MYKRIDIATVVLTVAVVLVAVVLISAIPLVIALMAIIVNFLYCNFTYYNVAAFKAIPGCSGYGFGPVGLTSVAQCAMTLPASGSVAACRTRNQEPTYRLQRFGGSHSVYPKHLVKTSPDQSN